MARGAVISLAAHRRARRVLLLLLSIALLSAADLVVTLTHLSTIGMQEANPIAAFIIRWSNSPLPLLAYKAATAGLAMILLFALRHRRQAEIGAWLCLGILCLMVLQWTLYSRDLSRTDTGMLAERTATDADWLTLVEDGE